MGCVDFQIFEQSGRPIVAFEPREIENQAGLTCLLQALMKQGVHPFQVAFAELARKRRPCPIDFHGSVTLMERRVSL